MCKDGLTLQWTGSNLDEVLALVQTIASVRRVDCPGPNGGIVPGGQLVLEVSSAEIQISLGDWIIVAPDGRIRTNKGLPVSVADLGRSSMKTTDLTFTVDAGKTFRNGKVNWPDMVRLNIPKEKALSFALDVLRTLERDDPSDDGDSYQFPLFGKLEDSPR